MQCNVFCQQYNKFQQVLIQMMIIYLFIKLLLLLNRESFYKLWQLNIINFIFYEMDIVVPKQIGHILKVYINNRS